jgi:hypothetical protein
MDLRTMKHLLLLIAFVCIPFGSFAQKKELLEDKETILARAAQAFDASLRPAPNYTRLS